MSIQRIYSVGGLAAVLAITAPTHASAACANPEISFESVAVAGGDREEFERELRRSIARACDWWGATFDGTFVITIEDSRGPSMALVPSWRGERGKMLFRATPVRTGRAAIQHEVVHVFAPNANRFLAEGFAVYAHEHLGGNKAYPNNGADLHVAAKPLAARADMAALERIATPDRLGSGGLSEDEAYVVAGSFVRFLVERYGLEKFRALYATTPLALRSRNAGEPARWAAIYGVDFARLVSDWRAALP